MGRGSWSQDPLGSILEERGRGLLPLSWDSRALALPPTGCVISFAGDNAHHCMELSCELGAWGHVSAQLCSLFLLLLTPEAQLHKLAWGRAAHPGKRQRPVLWAPGRGSLVRQEEALYPQRSAPPPPPPRAPMVPRLPFMGLFDSSPAEPTCHVCHQERPGHAACWGSRAKGTARRLQEAWGEKPKAHSSTGPALDPEAKAPGWAAVPIWRLLAV